MKKPAPSSLPPSRLTLLHCLIVLALQAPGARILGAVTPDPNSNGYNLQIAS